MNEPARELERRRLWKLFTAYLRLSLRGKASRAFAGRFAGTSFGLSVLLGMYAAIGLAVGVAASAHVDVFAYALLMHGMTFVMVGLGLTAESGDALFNRAESDVLGHRPVPPRTLLVAKALALLAFTLLLALALNLPAAVLGLRTAGARPWLPAVHLLAVVVLGTFCVSAVVLAYGLVARVVGRERFETVAAWSQVTLAVSFLAASHGLPRLAAHMQGVGQAPPVLLVLVPPAWFAGLESSLGAAHAAPVNLAFGAVGLVATAALGWVAFGRLAPVEMLARAVAPHTRSGVPAPAAGAIAGRLGWWLRDPVERAAFRLAAVYLRRDREIKTRLYPSLVMFAFFPLLALISPSKSGGNSIPLLSVSMLGMLPAVALEAMRQSSNHTAAEVFASAPLASTGRVFHGVRKAAMWYLLLPGLLLAVALSALIVPAGLSLAIPGLIALPTFSLLPGLFGDYLPLSIPPTRGQQAGANLLLMTISTTALVVLLSTSWIASRTGRLPELLVVETAIVAAVHWGLRAWIAARPLRPK